MLWYILKHNIIFKKTPNLNIFFLVYIYKYKNLYILYKFFIKPKCLKKCEDATMEKQYLSLYRKLYWRSATLIDLCLYLSKRSATLIDLCLYLSKRKIYKQPYLYAYVFDKNFSLSKVGLLWKRYIVKKLFLSLSLKWLL